MFRKWTLMLFCYGATAVEGNGDDCYQNVLRKCEKLADGQIVNETTCKISSAFKDCAHKIVVADCSETDQTLLITHLMAKVPQTAQTCFYWGRTRGPIRNQRSLPDRCKMDSVPAMGNDCSAKALDFMKQVHSEGWGRNKTLCCTKKQLYDCMKRGMYSLCGTMGIKMFEAYVKKNKDEWIHCDRDASFDCQNLTSSQRNIFERPQTQPGQNFKSVAITDSAASQQASASFVIASLAIFVINYD